MSQFRLETEADMLNYLDKDYGHGVGATYTRSGTASSISVILNNEFILQDEGIGLEALKPIAYARSVDVPNASFGDLLNVEAIKEFIGLSIQLLYASSNPSKPNLIPALKPLPTLDNIPLWLCSAIRADTSPNTSDSGFTCSNVKADTTSGEKFGYNLDICVARVASFKVTRSLVCLYCFCLL